MKTKLSEQATAELRAYLTPLVTGPALGVEAAVAVAAYFSEYHSEFTVFKTCNLPHNSLALAMAESRGAIVRVSFACEGVVGLQSYYGILRYFVQIVEPPAKLAYVDYFARLRADVPHLVQRAADKDALSVRFVPVDSIDCPVMLLPHAANAWFVVDALDKPE